MTAVIRISAENGDPYMAIAAPGFDVDDADGIRLDTRLGGCLHTLEYDEAFIGSAQDGFDTINTPWPTGALFAMWQFRPDTDWDNVFDHAGNAHGDLTLSSTGVFWSQQSSAPLLTISETCGPSSVVADFSDSGAEVEINSRRRELDGDDEEIDVMPVHVEMWAFGVT